MTNKSGQKMQRTDNLRDKPFITQSRVLTTLKVKAFRKHWTKRRKWWSLHHVNLTLCHTIPTFNNTEEEAFWKHFGKRRKCWEPAFSPFPIMFSTLSKIYLSFSDIYFVVCNSFQFGSSRTGSSGFFRGSVLGQNTSEPSLVLVKPRKAWIMWAVAVIWLKYC